MHFSIFLTVTSVIYTKKKTLLIFLSHLLPFHKPLLPIFVAQKLNRQRIRGNAHKTHASIRRLAIQNFCTFCTFRARTFPRFSHILTRLTSFFLSLLHSHLFHCYNTLRFWQITVENLPFLFSGMSRAIIQQSIFIFEYVLVSSQIKCDVSKSLGLDEKIYVSSRIFF